MPVINSRSTEQCQKRKMLMLMLTVRFVTNNVCITQHKNLIFDLEEK